MKKKTLSIAILLCFVLVLSSLLTGCASENILGAKESSTLDVFKNEPQKSATYTSISELSLDGEIASGLYGNFFYTEKTESSSVIYTVYDIRTLSKVYTYTDTFGDSKEFNDFDFEYDADFFLLKEDIENSTKTTIIYKGVEVVTKDGNLGITTNEELFDAFKFFNFAGDVYRQTEKEVKLVKSSKDGSVTFNEDAIFYCGEKYFWVSAENYGVVDSTHFIAYDMNLNPVTEYAFPTYAQNAKIFSLAKDRLLVQYLVPVDSYSTDYNLFVNSSKYNLYQSIYNTEAKIETAINLKGFVESVVKVGGQDGIKENRISSFAKIVPIEQKRLNEEKTAYYNVNENGGIIEKFVNPNGLKKIQVYAAISKDRYFIYNPYYGAYQVVDQRGKLIVSFGEDEEQQFNYNFYIKSDTIYDYDGKKVVELQANEDVLFFENSILIRSKVSQTGAEYEVYLLAKGKDKQYIGSTATSEDKQWLACSDETADKCYIVKTSENGQTKYTYYNELGEKLGENSTTYSYVFASNDDSTVIYKTVEQGVTKYFVMK